MIDWARNDRRMSRGNARRQEPALPPGGCIFPSDHYPVFADVQLVPRR